MGIPLLIIWFLIVTSWLWGPFFILALINKSAARKYARMTTEKEREQYMDHIGRAFEVSGMVDSMSGSKSPFPLLSYWLTGKFCEKVFEREYRKEMDRICEAERPAREARKREEEELRRRQAEEQRCLYDETMKRIEESNRRSKEIEEQHLAIQKLFKECEELRNKG